LRQQKSIFSPPTFPGGENYLADYQQEGLAWEFSQEGILWHRISFLFGSVTIIVRYLKITSTITGEEGAKEKVEDVENAGES